MMHISTFDIQLEWALVGIYLHAKHMFLSLLRQGTPLFCWMWMQSPQRYWKGLDAKLQLSCLDLLELRLVNPGVGNSK